VRRPNLGLQDGIYAVHEKARLSFLRLAGKPALPLNVPY